jgi:phage terminase large subunit-like protein
MLPPSEALWSELADDEAVSKARKAAEQEYRDLTTDQLKALRIRAKKDLYFLAYGILGYDLASPRLHGSLCRWTERTRGTQYRLLLLPRGHYKSTFCTISESIQTALPDLLGDQPYPWNLGSDVKLLLGHENRESASRFLFEIGEAFLRKPLMLALFPELVPNRREHRINKWEIELPRSSHHKEPTFDTIGAGGAAQGRHYNRLKLDDLIGEAARDSGVVMERIITWFDNVNSLLTRPRFDGWDLVGTRWSFKDVYSHAMEMYGIDEPNSIIRCFEPNEFEPGALSVYARGALENGVPTFPEEFTVDWLNRIRKNPRVYAAQYANNPRESGLNEFDISWLKYYNKVGDHHLTVFEGDATRKVNVWDLDRCILVDPSMGERNDSDESGMIVTGTDQSGNIYILETIKARMKPPELIEKIFDLHFKWRPRVVSIEDVVFSGIFAYWFEEKCRDINVFPNVFRYKPGSKRSKRARILGMANYFANGQVYLSEGMNQFRDEYEWFGISDSEHLLDAFAQGPESWRFTKPVEDAFAEEDLVRKIIDQRDAITGY